MHRVNLQARSVAVARYLSQARRAGLLARARAALIAMSLGGLGFLAFGIGGGFWLGMALLDHAPFAAIMALIHSLCLGLATAALVKGIEAYYGIAMQLAEDPWTLQMVRLALWGEEIV